MKTFMHISLIIHIICGCIALLSGLGAIIFRNKVKIHKPFGKTYFWSMTVIFVTAFYLSLYTQNWFLLFISVFTYYSTITGYRALKLKKLHMGQNPSKFDWAIEILFGLMNCVFIAFSVWLLFNNDVSFGIISLVFGIIGIRGNTATIKRLRKKLSFKNYWLLAHIGGMMGSYIGAVTTFVVNNNKWIHAPAIVVWLGPAAFLVPLIIYEINKHEKKAGKFVIT